MSLLYNTAEKFRNRYFDKSIRNSNTDKNPIMSNTSIKLKSKSLIFDTTYNLFNKNNKNNNYNKLIKRKLDTPSLNNKKYRNKTTNIKIYTNFSKKKKIHLKKYKTSSELMKNKKMNKVNSIIININNSQFNKTNINTNSNNNSFRNSTNTQINEKFFNNVTSLKYKNNNDDYFYDFTTNKKQNNDKENKFFNLYNTNTYNTKFNKNNYYHKVKQGIQKSNNNMKEKIDFKICNKKPIKIKTDIISNEINNKTYNIKKNNSEKIYNKYINNELNKPKIHKYLSSKLFHNYTFNNKISSESKHYLTAEKNYLEKWQLINGINIEKVYSLSNIQSKKLLNKIPKKNKNTTLSQRQNNNKFNDYYFRGNNTNNIKEINTDIYNNTEINQNINKIINDFKFDSISNQNHKMYKTENKIILQNDVILNEKNNNKNVGCNHKNDKEVENEDNINNNTNLKNDKNNETKNIDKVIERKKREIDLLNIMKFTSEIYDSNKQYQNNYNTNNEIINSFNINDNIISKSNIKLIDNKNLLNKNFHKMNVIDYDDNNNNNLYFNYKDNSINNSNEGMNIKNNLINNNNEEY